MKKLLLMMMAVIATNICSYAQLKEVRGILTKSVEYKEYENGSYKTYHGFEFVNENNYSVWVDAELCTQGFSVNFYDVQGGTRATKSFSLKPKETYIWKCGEKMIFSGYGYSEKFFVQYKAYKAE